MSEHEDDAPACGAPCPPDAACEACDSYWNRMRHDGYWVDGTGWTDKGMQEMTK